MRPSRLPENSSAAEPYRVPCSATCQCLTLILLPAKCPELNPQENFWQFMRDNWLSNQVFKSFDDIADHWCDAWNKLVDQPWKIMSIGLRDWAYRS